VLTSGHLKISTTKNPKFKSPNAKSLKSSRCATGRCNGKELPAGTTGRHNPFLPVQRHNGKVPVKVYKKKPLHSSATTIFTRCDVDREKLDNLALGKLHFGCRKLGELAIGNLNVELFEFENL
jgi:hypothetical protein